MLPGFEHLRERVDWELLSPAGEDGSGRHEVILRHKLRTPLDECSAYLNVALKAPSAESERAQLRQPVPPMWAIRPLARRHFCQRQEQLLFVNLSRLSAQWEEVVNRSIAGQETGSDQQVGGSGRDYRTADRGGAKRSSWNRPGIRPHRRIKESLNSLNPPIRRFHLVS